MTLASVALGVLLSLGLPAASFGFVAREAILSPGSLASAQPRHSWAPKVATATVEDVRVSSPPDDTATVEKRVQGTATETTMTTTVQTHAPRPTSPARLDKQLFECDDSVDFWETFDSQGNDGNLRRIQEIIQKYVVNGNTQSRAYWTSHLLRTGYFTLNAAMGTIATDLHSRFMERRRKERETDVDNNSNKMNSRRQKGANLLGSTERLLNSSVPTRLILEALLCFEQDYKAVESGLIKYPWDAAIQSNYDNNNNNNNNAISFQFDHRQLNPLFALRETNRVVRESMKIFSRRDRLKGKPSDTWMFGKEESSARIYPEYYQNDYHYQSDGWMSTESAEVYEASTETLFLGRQDSMQRQTLIPIKKYLGKDTFPQSILEVAAGTGRFSTFVRDNFPTSDVTLTDLSPFYLEKARKNDKYWREYRGETAMKESVGFASFPEPAKFVQANAEDLPFADNSFDVVTCIYLFHELPEEARRRAAREMARVLKPGGMVVLTDSIQRGDRPPVDGSIGNFKYLNEPHYENYVSVPMSDLFDGLLEPKDKYISSSTKTLSFAKPMKVC